MFGRSLWNENFQLWPTWPCPNCDSVALGLIKGSLKEEETGPSKRAQSEDYWNPEMITRRFAALLKCGNPACGEIVAVCGTSSAEESHYLTEEGDQSSYDDYYIPKFFTHAPPVFQVRNYPKPVIAELTSAFSLIWVDSGACANRLRAGVELLLDEQGIQKTSVNNGKRGPLSLHSRIEKFAKKNKEAAEYLMAIKWVGNSGSHKRARALSRVELLNAFELFEGALELLYVKKAEQFKKLAAEINKRKGRPKRVKNGFPF